MKQFLLLVLLLLLSNIAFCQKKNLDTTIINAWTTVKNGSISPSGKYIAYLTNASLIRTIDESTKTQITIRQSDNKWKYCTVIPHIESKVLFSPDDRYALFESGNIDELKILNLSSKKTELLKKVFMPSLYLHRKYLIYIDRERTAHFRNWSDGNEKTFHNVKEYSYGESGNDMLITYETGKNNNSIDYIDLKTLKQFSVCKNKNIIQQKVVRYGLQRAIKIDSAGINEIWTYSGGKQKAVKCLSEGDKFLNTEMKLGHLRHFSFSGRFIYFTLKSDSVNQSEPEKNPNPNLQLLSYLNRTIIPNKIKISPASSPQYEKLVVFDRTTKKISSLENDSKNVLFQIEDFVSYRKSTSSFFIENNNDRIENWRTGEVINGNYFSISPSEKYIFYMKKDGKSFCLYDTHSHSETTVLIVKDSTEWQSYYDSDESQRPHPVDLHWIDKERKLVLTSKHDIWVLNLNKPSNLICVTRGYGKRHKIMFSTQFFAERETFTGNTLVPAFDLENKRNGYFSINLSEVKDPKPVIFDNHLYVAFGSNRFQSTGEIIIKAKNSNRWLLMRQSAKESPNFFLTNDFKKLTPVSDLHPEDSCFWLSSELHSWKGYDGKEINGILYKPEKFDPTHRYPVIIYYYEKLSMNLNAFLEPAASSGPINIPWFVNKGYLVFTPDIWYKKGFLGESALNCVESAGKYLATLSFVNADKIGIQGHSFGGIETNYILTHSNLFAAACSASGASDFISAFGSLTKDGLDLQSPLVFGQPRMGTSLYERPDLYIKNSPVFSLHNVTTPLLLYSGKNDSGLTSPSQSLELFLGLRRLGKPSWMLLYNAGHDLLYSPKAIRNDFSDRMDQFFDHYLMDKPSPMWMTREGTQDKNYDNSLRTPNKNGLLTPSEKNKVDSLLHKELLKITF
ncbi:alpha/beta hydrolase family protein [Pedobacter paludis]|uniref:Peptidase S9 prolyl oligopeptidase catalytic domain-containing protein n=1 Tax=Pedobacter paludis TaxID=2203212 RepID=A0A317F455_9SPHI|nr:prolyl oligopeptidase family serine peptidase [Pedobacter paludis]PWS33342.1 hypothetical protein DF947_01575 [Pedobacter paludis]